MAAPRASSSENCARLSAAPMRNDPLYASLSLPCACAFTSKPVSSIKAMKIFKVRDMIFRPPSGSGNLWTSRVECLAALDQLVLDLDIQPLVDLVSDQAKDDDQEEDGRIDADRHVNAF